MKKKPIKTNATRILAAAGIQFETAEYDYDESDLSGLHIAKEMGEDPALVYKTLTARGDKTGINVFCVPVTHELDLKKCALCTGDKKIEMVHVKELFGLTGYVRGGCSPVGMKKQYPTWIDSSARQHSQIYVSAGRRGGQILLSPSDLAAAVGAQFADIAKSVDIAKE
ncbi:MAG: Cys-tRNA(Pro) deacylase [Acutalibacteraceae bacterium]